MANVVFGNTEVKRVPLDFDWPLNTIWKGYINPDAKECVACGGSGRTKALQRLNDIVHLLLTSGEDSISGTSHPSFSEHMGIWMDKVPSPDMEELTTALAGREPGTFGYDTMDMYEASQKIIVAAGLSVGWGDCPVCEGSGETSSGDWEATEPPEGDGYQCWETVTEGSPVSPVFASKDELDEWMQDNPR